MTADKGPRRAGDALLATAADQAMATEWQEALTAQGIMSVLHGHRGDDDVDTAFTGIDVLVPASALKQAREILGPSVVPAEDDERPFPWLWLALGPALFFVVVVAVVVVLVAV
jgi:hypothetical protein